MTAEPSRQSIANWFRRVVTVAVVIPVAALAVAILLAPILWIGDMLTFFLPWIGGAALALTVLALALRFRLIAATGGVLAILVLLPVIGAWSPPPADPVGAEQLRVTTFNTLGGTADPDLLMQFLEVERPDILVMEEYSGRLDAELNLASMFAYRSDSSQTGVPSLILFSRYPILDVAIIPPIGSVRGQGVIRVAIDWNQVEIVAYAVHATTPRHGESDWQERNEILAALALRIQDDEHETPIIVAGDFNTPPWSPFYRSLTKEALLTDTSGAFLPAATRIVDRGWLPTLFGSPVDHILVSEGIGWSPNRVGPDLGSDHRPVTADILIPTN